MNISVNKSRILNKIKEHLRFSSDAEFARFLDIKPQTLASWHSRNSFDTELIYSKCGDISAGWLLTGEGEMIEHNNISILEEQKITYKNTDRVCLICNEKDKLIYQQGVTIEVLRESLSIMKDRINDLEKHKSKQT